MYRVGSGDHRPSLLQVANTVCPLQVKLRVDPTSTGGGETLLIVTPSTGGGLEKQVTAKYPTVKCMTKIIM